MVNKQEIPPCFVLTAPQGDPARRKSVESQMSSAGIPFRFISGLTPLDKAVSEKYSSWRNLLFMKRSLTPGEIAVYLGHQKIWQEIIDSGASCGLVFEDDFCFHDPEHITPILEKASICLGRWDLIKFFDYRPRRALAEFSENGIKLGVYKRPNSSLIGYVLTAECCRILLARQYVFRPVDEELRYWFETRLRIATVIPNPVRDISPELEGSLLEAERLKLRMNRNLLRSLYGNFITAYINICCEVWSRWVVWSYK